MHKKLYEKQNWCIFAMLFALKPNKKFIIMDIVLWF